MNQSIVFRYFLLRLIACISVATQVSEISAQEVSVVDSFDYQEIELNQLNIDHGLSQGMINDVALDSTGYLWVATKDGLNRYDGSRFKVFRNEEEKPTSVSENFISNIHVDKHDRLWVATQSNGLNLYNSQTESFLRIKSSNSKLSSDFIGVVKEDNLGNILVETLDDKGYNLIKPMNAEKIERVDSLNIESLEKAYPGVWALKSENAWTKDLDFEWSGAAWYCSKDTVYRLENPKLKESSVLRFPVVQSNKQLQEDGSKIFFSNDKKHVYRIDSIGVVSKYDDNAKNFAPIVEVPKFRLTRNRVYMDCENNLWVFDHSHKLWCLNLKTKTLYCYSPNWRQLDEGAINHLPVDLEDKSGNLWVGTGGNGLLQLNPELLRFKRHVSNPEQGGHPVKDGRISLFRTSITGNKALYNKEIAKRWLSLSSIVKSENPDIDLNQNYTHLCQDKNGDFWISAIYKNSGRDCILRIDGQTGVVDSAVCGESPNHDRWFGHPIFMLSNGNVWFSEKGIDGSASLYEFNPITRELKSFQFPVRIEKYQYRFVSDWYENQLNSELWLATTHGLFSFNLKSEKWKAYKHNPSDGTGVSSNILLSVEPDPVLDNVLWIGTEGAGLDRLEVDAGRFKNFSTKDGLPNNVVYAIRQDADQNLWVSTNKGLSRFKPDLSPVFTNYNKSDGLSGNEFNRYEFSTSTNGELFFGGTRGLVHFDPRAFNMERVALKVMINELKVLNKPVVFGTDQSILDCPIERCEKLVFKPKYDMITFGFTMLDFSNQASQKFKYRLKGYNDKWINARDERSATYTNLPYGSYTFQVIGRNSTGVWSENPTQINITVLAPWYATWWFRSIMLLLFATTLYGFYRYRTAELLRVEKMRNRIAQDLHDEIGSTLSSISLYSAVMQRSAGKFPANINDILGKIIESTSEMMESMNDMVWTIKADNDSFEHVVYRMRAFAGTMTEAKDMLLHFKADPKAEKLELGMEKRKNIYLVFKETVNNAVKYSNAKKLSVVIRQEESSLIMQVKDDGIGFDPENYNHKNELLGGNGLRGMMGRAKEMEANLQIESAPGNGCVVTLKVPI